MNKTFSAINKWHKSAFPNCSIGEMMDKVKEEHLEFVSAVECGRVDEISDELADCFITLFSAAGILGINPKEAIAGKFERVKKKYPPK